MTDPIDAAAERGGPVPGALTPTTSEPERECVSDPFAGIFQQWRASNITRIRCTS